MSFLPLLLAFMLALGIISFVFWKYIQKHKAKTRHARRMLYKGILAILHDVDKALDTYCLSHRIEDFKKTIDVLKRPEDVVSASKESEYINRVLYQEKTTADELLKKVNSPVPVSHTKLEEYKAVARNQLQTTYELFGNHNDNRGLVEIETPLNQSIVGSQENAPGFYHPATILAARLAAAHKSLNLFEMMMVASDRVAVQMLHVINCLVELEVKLEGILQTSNSANSGETIIFSPEKNSYHREAGLLSSLLSQEMD